ncbi:outer membrane protein [Bartonella sp. LJL80]
MKYRAGLFLAVLLATSNLASAADIDLDKVPEVAIATESKPVYFKAYTGLAIADISGLGHLGGNYLDPDAYWKNKGDMDKAFLGGVGLGYRVNDLFRFDGTIEYRAKNSVTGRDVTALDTRKYDGDVSSLVIMGNAYVDIATFRNITPYLGAGLGASGNRAKDFRVSAQRLDLKASSNTNWDLAWALHAGVGVKLSKTLTLDIGYSYTDLGDAKTGTFDDAGSIKLDHLTSHDVKIGIRYAFR